MQRILSRSKNLFWLIVTVAWFTIPLNGYASIDLEELSSNSSWTGGLWDKVKSLCGANAPQDETAPILSLSSPSLQEATSFYGQHKWCQWARPELCDFFNLHDKNLSMMMCGALGENSVVLLFLTQDLGEEYVLYQYYSAVVLGIANFSLFAIPYLSSEHSSSNVLKAKRWINTILGFTAIVAPVGRYAAKVNEVSSFIPEVLSYASYLAIIANNYFPWEKFTTTEATP